MWADFVSRGSGLRAAVSDDEAPDAARASASGGPVRARSLLWHAAPPRAGHLSISPTWRPVAFGAAAALTFGLTAGAVAVGVASPIGDRPALFVSLRAVLCLGLLLVALVMGVRGAGGRIAVQLLATSALFAVTGLTTTDAQLPFTIGRVAVSAAIVPMMYLCFAYPTGRIEDVPDRRLIAASAGAIGALLAANILLSNVPPVAGPFVRCAGAGCPANPLNPITLGAGPSRALSSGLALVTALAMVATAGMLARRALRVTPVQRRSVAPLLAWAWAAAIGYGFFVTVRAFDAGARLLSPAAVIVAALAAALPLALALAMPRGRVFAMTAVERLIAELEAASSLGRLQQTMARAFRDPQLQLLLWDAAEERYVDVGGRPVDLSLVGPARGVARVKHGGERLAAIVHDPVVPADVIGAAGSAISLALNNARLQVTLSASIRALEASRKRVARAADEERRRIEHDLHDGAQQGLIAVRIRLQLLEDVARTDPEAVAPALADTGRRVQAALDEIRDLAHGIYPSALSDLGPAYALADVARALPFQVVLHVDLPRRVSPEVETAVYFCCVQ